MLYQNCVNTIMGVSDVRSNAFDKQGIKNIPFY